MKKEPKKNIRETVFPTPGLHLRSAGEGEPVAIEGTAIVFNSDSIVMYEDDRVVIRERIAPEAITEELLRRSDILLTLYHDNDRILGRSLNGKGTMSYKLTPNGVTFSCVPPDTEDGRTARELVERGDISGCSFAYRVNTERPGTVTREVVTKDGRKEVTYVIREIEGIYDFTLTPRPAYRATTVEASRRDIEEFISGADELLEKEDAIRRRAEILRLRDFAAE